jgi:hypothetical protein
MANLPVTARLAEQKRLMSTDRASVQEEGRQEALRHKWITSQQAGRDLGDHAIHCWVRDHWWGFLRAKWVEHLQGVKFWTELDQNDFGLLHREFLDISPLLHQILDRIKRGQENLDIILWARDDQVAMCEVLRVLERLDINSRRLAFQYAIGIR